MNNKQVVALIIIGIAIIIFVSAIVYFLVIREIPGQEGDFCSSDQQCAQGFYCGGLGQCSIGQAGREIGQSCILDRNCRYGLICGRNWTCQNPPSEIARIIPATNTENLRNSSAGNLKSSSAEDFESAPVIGSFHLQEIPDFERSSALPRWLNLYSQPANFRLSPSPTTKYVSSVLSLQTINSPVKSEKIRLRRHTDQGYYVVENGQGEFLSYGEGDWPQFQKSGIEIRLKIVR